MATATKQGQVTILARPLEITHERDDWRRFVAVAAEDPVNQRELDFSGKVIVTGRCAGNILCDMAYRMTGRWIMSDFSGRREFKLSLAKLEPVPEALNKKAFVDFFCQVKRELDRRRIDRQLPRLGIGPARIEAIFAKFQRQSFQIATHHPEQVAQIRGWTYEQAEEFSRILKEYEQDQQAYLELFDLASNGALSSGMVAEIFHRWRLDAPGKIRRNPYSLIKAFRGIAFKSCDKIATLNLGWSHLAGKRIQAAIHEAVRLQKFEGHTLFWKSSFLSEIRNLVGNRRAPSKAIAASMRSILEFTAGRKRFVTTGQLYNAARSISDYFAEKTFEVPREIQFGHWDQAQLDQLNEKQQVAYRAAMKGGVLLLTGGPGRGKTYTLTRILAGLKRRGREVLVVAPTGRAAARITEISGDKAVTIHSVVFGCEETEALISANDVIVDESSMVSTELLARLIKVMKPRANLILVGDPHQLPPIQAGRPFRDLIDSGLCRQVHLEQVMRTDRLGLIKASEAVLRQDFQAFQEAMDESFYWYDLNAEQAQEAIVEIVKDLMAGEVHPSEIQAITATNGYKTSLEKMKPLSDRDLNQRLAPVMNWQALETDAKASGEPVRIGDRLMNLKNKRLQDPRNKRELYFANGEIGHAADWIGDKLKVEFGTDDDPKVLTYDAKFGNVQHGYAATCHKFQGSESPYVIVALDDSARRFVDPHWLYTALTRAKLQVIVLAPERTLREAFKNRPRVLFRNTLLPYLLREIQVKRRKLTQTRKDD